MKRFSCVVACLLYIVVCSGCPKSIPFDPVKVTGKVTYNGQPISVRIEYSPMEPQAGEKIAAYGVPGEANTDGKGNYTIITVAGLGKVAPGKYRVAVFAENPHTDPESVEYRNFKPPFPAKYSNFNTSGLVAEVTEKGPNVFDFDLKD